MLAATMPRAGGRRLQGPSKATYLPGVRPEATPRPRTAQTVVLGAQEAEHPLVDLLGAVHGQTVAGTSQQLRLYVWDEPGGVGQGAPGVKGLLLSPTSSSVGTETAASSSSG
jgi:hypothetical protein